MNGRKLDLKTVYDVIRKTEIGTGKPSKTPGSYKLNWREPHGEIEGGALYFYSSEVVSDQKLSKEQLRAKEKEVRALLLSDLVAAGFYSKEQLKERGDSVVDLVVKVHEEEFRLNHDTKNNVKEGRAAVVSGSIKFHAEPNISAAMRLQGI